MKGRIESLRIDELAAGGDGVGRVNGKVCFVPLAAPGDLLRVEVVRENKGFSRARIVEVVERGPARRDPSCALFGECGGCAWMHIAEEVQLEAKRKILARALRLETVDVLASPEPLGYRENARLHWVAPEDQEPVLGFAKRESHEVVDVRACPVLKPGLSARLGPIRDALHGLDNVQADIRLSFGQGQVAAAIEADIESLGPLVERLGRMVPDTLSGLAVLHDGQADVVAGTGEVESLGVDHEPLLAPAASFGQTNAGINRLLGETLAAWISPGEFRSAIELFSGNGNLTVLLARRVERMSSADLDPWACDAASRNLASRSLTNVKVRAGDALEIYLKRGLSRDLVVLDPPRTGAFDLAKVMAVADHKAILYVSCDPATLARDIGVLKTGGFKLQRVLGFDMFPQTAHLEAAALLVK